ncbi:hypothetical protein TW80_16625 [Loktanella sp. S4079]|nr:hypothetical protein TW80_16625 [Loktanella sp. S4079]
MALQKFVSDLRLLDSGQIMFRGRPAQQSATPNADAQLQLTEMIYKYLYTHPIGDIGDAFRAVPPDEELIAALIAANNTQPTVQSGWVVRTPQPDGAIIAERFGVTRKFIPGQFMANGGCAPIQAGSEVTAIHLAGSKTVQPGFFHIFGQAQLDLAELPQIVRLYFNIAAPTGAAPLAKYLSTALNAYGIPFTYKTSVRLCDYSRTDTAVLYLPRRFYEIAAMALGSEISLIDPLLGDDQPMFTKPLSRGIGLAEDPADAVSFGASRSGMIARAIGQTCQDGTICPDAFWSAFQRICDQEKLDVRRLHLNPGSRESYDFPQMLDEAI